MAEHRIIFSTDDLIQVLSGQRTQFMRIVKTRCSTCEEDGHLYFYDPNGTDGDDRHPAYVDAVKCCPYGQPGDLIRVQETWCRHDKHANKFYYRADHPNDDSITDHWRSPACMPRRACRTVLRNKSVHVERALDISLINFDHDGVHFNDAGPANPWVWVVEFELVDIMRRWMKAHGIRTWMSAVEGTWTAQCYLARNGHKSCLYTVQGSSEADAAAELAAFLNIPHWSELE